MAKKADFHAWDRKAEAARSENVEVEAEAEAKAEAEAEGKARNESAAKLDKLHP